jgi:hypothetical protein
MLPWAFSEEFAAEKYMAQLQHNMWVTNSRMAALSIITGGGKWVEISIAAAPLYQHLLLMAEKKFWRCVQFGDIPRLFGVEPPRPRIEAVRSVDMASSNAWAEFAAPLHQVGLPRTRAGEDRTQGADAGGCQGCIRSRRPGEALQGGGSFRQNTPPATLAGRWHVRQQRTGPRRILCRATRKLSVLDTLPN